MITTKELYWVAGFLEGEGCFWAQRPSASAMITASQVQRSPLDHLRAVIGGTLRGPKKSSNKNAQMFFIWSIYGVRAAGLMMTLYLLMSPNRRGKIIEVLAEWKKHPPADKHKTHCVNGHEYNKANTHPYINSRHGGKSRDCRICNRARDRTRYAGRREQERERQRNRRALARTIALAGKLEGLS